MNCALTVVQSHDPSLFLKSYLCGAAAVGIILLVWKGVDLLIPQLRRLWP